MSEFQNDILPIFQLSSSDSIRFGGKASTLGVLHANDFLVPSGIALTADAVASFTNKNSHDILSILRVNIDENARFAVRSSAPLEDGETHAWAGLFSSFLDVPFEDLPEYIRACAESAKSERVQVYAKKLGIVVAGDIPVIIQHMLNPYCAGVAFSRHPLYPNKNLVIIEAVRGTAEKLVSGAETPEHWTIDSETKLTIESSVFSELLSNEFLVDITDACKRIESLLSFPVDIEWAIENGTLYILQARPITGITHK